MLLFNEETWFRYRQTFVILRYKVRVKFQLCLLGFVFLPVHMHCCLVVILVPAKSSSKYA